MDYCEIPEFFDANWPIARKQHKCCECGQPIHTGEKYGKFTGKWAGRMDTYKQHLDCEKACVYIRDKFNGGDCIGFGELFERWRDYGQVEDRKHPEYRSIVARIIWRTRKEQRLAKAAT